MGYLLTPAERRYTVDAAQGLTARKSAERWGVPTDRVTSTLARVRARLGAANITHAVVLALIEHEISPEDVKGTQL